MRKQNFIIATALALNVVGVAYAQNKLSSAPTPSRAAQTETAPEQQQTAVRPAAGFDLSEYGVRLQPETRLIVMMAALEAAGFDPTPKGTALSPFRAQVRKEQEDLDADLRARLKSFYERAKLADANATPAEQAARYVSLAYALGPAPDFDTPARTDDLPDGVLEVLDFAPLLREFYRKSGINERLPAYIRLYQTEGDRLRRPVAGMMRSVLSYLHTRPTTTVIDRVPVKSSGSSSGAQKKDAKPVYTTRERQFIIVPDLLAAPGAINFRVIGDDYFAIVPSGTDPASSELRRAYLQYVIDPLVLRFNRDIAARREHLKQLLSSLTKTGTTVSPDVFLAVSRSVVAAADARLGETARLDDLAGETRSRLARISNATERAAILKEAEAARIAINDDAVAQLADAYERGAVLAFYFAEQLRGVETSGFDLSSLFGDMIASFDPARELKRPAEYAAARERALVARKARQAQRAAAAASATAETGTDSSRRATLIKALIEVDEMLRLKQYTVAEARLRTLLQEYQDEPRIMFALGRSASLSAREATDDEVRNERLNSALDYYRKTVKLSTADTDRALLSRAHEAIGRILEFFERNEEALNSFNAAIQIGPVRGGAYDDAVAGKRRLSPQR